MAPQAPELTGTERAELERPPAENTGLRAQLLPAPPTTPGAGQRDREGCGPGRDRDRPGRQLGVRQQRALRLGAVALACLALLFWGRPTGKVVLGLNLALLVALAIIEVLGRPPEPIQPSGEEELVSRAT